MKQTKSVLLLIPCFNEELSIANLLEEIKAACPGYQAVVINDGSKDQTSAVVKTKENTILLDLPVNLGVGGAVQTGFKFARMVNAEYAVKIDGDGQHSPNFIPQMIETLSERKSDIVIGSRFLNSTGFKSSTIRRFGIYFLQKLCLVLTGRNISDPTSGFRAYNRTAIEFLADHYPSFDYPEPEEIILASKNGLELNEIPVEMRERQKGSSTISSSGSVYYMLKVTLSMLFIFIRNREKR